MRAVADLTAVVCTRDRSAQLERALRSLRCQDLPPREILVVDNAPSDDSTRRVVERFPHVRYIRESVPGLDVARNRALGKSKTRIVAFLDDDTVPDVRWVLWMMQALEEHPRAAACTGRVEPLALETEGQRLFEANGGFSRGADPVCLPADAGRRLHGLRAPLIAWAVSVGSGCSLALRRDAILEIGGFDEALDLGAVLPGGGDLDVLWRLLEAGYEIVYEPRALAFHEHRTDVEAAVGQIVEHQRALVAFLTKTAGRTRGVAGLSVLAFLVWRLFKPGIRLVRRLAGRDPLPLRALMRMWWHTWRGLGAYRLALRTAQRLMSEAHREGEENDSVVETPATARGRAPEKASG